MIEGASLEMRQGGAGQKEQGIDVGVEGRGPLFVRDVADGSFAVLMRGVAHQNVDLAKGPHDIVDEFLAETGISQVAGQLQAAAREFFHVPFGLVGVSLLLGQIVDRDISAFAGKEDSHRAADSGIAAGDQGRLFLASLPAAEYSLPAKRGLGSRSFSKPGLPSFCLGNGGLGRDDSKLRECSASMDASLRLVMMLLLVSRSACGFRS